jgi:hypothetical protein
MIGAGIPLAVLPITRAQYLGKYAEADWVTERVIANVDRLLEPVNAGLLLAQADGVYLRRNSITGSLIGGTGNGGIRPDDCPIGSLTSWHKRHADEAGLELGPCAIDLYDPARALCTWALENRDRLIAIGILAIERPQWTPSWCHWQTQRVKSGHFAFVPSNDPPLVAVALPGELAA